MLAFTFLVEKNIFLVMHLYLTFYSISAKYGKYLLNIANIVSPLILANPTQEEHGGYEIYNSGRHLILLPLPTCYIRCIFAFTYCSCDSSCFTFYYMITSKRVIGEQTSFSCLGIYIKCRKSFWHKEKKCASVDA